VQRPSLWIVARFSAGALLDSIALYGYLQAALEETATIPTPEKLQNRCTQAILPPQLVLSFGWQVSTNRAIRATSSDIWTAVEMAETE
jgi:hypothetical protein